MYDTFEMSNQVPLTPLDTKLGPCPFICYVHLRKKMCLGNVGMQKKMHRSLKYKYLPNKEMVKQRVG